MLAILVVLAFYSIHWSIADLQQRGEQSVLYRALSVVGRIVWLAIQPMVWPIVVLVQTALRWMH